MPSIGNRQVIIAILLAATMVLAGCSGGGGGGSPTATDGSGPTATDGGSSDSSDGNGQMGQASAGNYQWSEGESYTYESESSRGSTSQYSWEVTSVSGGEVTVNLTSSFGGRTQTTTLTGPQGNVFNGSGQNPPQSLAFVFLQVPQLLIEGHTLQQGNSWTVSSGELNVGGTEQRQQQSQQIDVSVTGTSQVAGTQCYNIEATTPNQTISACVKDGWPFAPKLSLTLQTTTSTGGDTQTRSQTTTYTLVDYNRP